MVVRLFKNIDIGTAEFLQLCKKLYILVQIPLHMNLRPKHSVPNLYGFSLLLLVQLYKNIDKGTTEFLQLCEKTVPFGTNTIPNEFKTKTLCTKAVQLFPFVL